MRWRRLCLLPNKMQINAKYPPVPPCGHYVNPSPRDSVAMAIFLSKNQQTT